MLAEVAIITANVKSLLDIGFLFFLEPLSCEKTGHSAPAEQAKEYSPR
jgi:hypothetical protein